uniref:Uncharacterized protein n=1 Tax=Pseudo-nitzschia australis TaxID=44445 RepID=A0A7S4AJS2_9STRA|mmetsp:Transcript_5633/g.12279  ORF Transcript_5633/g.12279 Transcript_5633/m.12279 type:complete len:136 (-) Transcript_5633:78-485(-)
MSAAATINEYLSTYPSCVYFYCIYYFIYIYSLTHVCLFHWTVLFVCVLYDGDDDNDDDEEQQQSPTQSITIMTKTISTATRRFEPSWMLHTLLCTKHGAAKERLLGRVPPMWPEPIQKLDLLLPPKQGGHRFCCC